MPSSPILPRAPRLLALLLRLALFGIAAAEDVVPTSGNATLTHYDLPNGYIASCGCVGYSTRYPTAALNSMAYGSTTSYGPSCGVCYRLRLLSTIFTPPPPEGNGVLFAWNDASAPSLVVKITDDCPLGGQWCSQTPSSPLNEQGASVHFDLAWPSRAISESFFPTDQGRDYGAWSTSYDLVDCREWNGYHDKEAWGSDWAQQSSACCPLRPSYPTDPPNADAVPSNPTTCPSYSSQVQQRLSVGDMSAQVPNTSNILSKAPIGEPNSASSLMQSSFLWLLAPLRAPLEDVRVLDDPPLLRSQGRRQ